MKTDIQRMIESFHATALPCRKHGKQPAYDYDGVHSVSCESGCIMIDAENSSMTPLFIRWQEAQKG